MVKLDYKQLAFILGIEPKEALEKILYVHSKVTGKDPPPRQESVKDYLFIEQKKKKVRTNLPESYDVGLLAVHLNLPTLQSSVEDIHNNYLKRAATKRYILLDFPEKELRIKLKHQIKVPPVLASLLSLEDVETIENEWARRYGIGAIKV